MKKSTFRLAELALANGTAPPEEKAQALNDARADRVTVLDYLRAHALLAATSGKPYPLFWEEAGAEESKK